MPKFLVVHKLCMYVLILFSVLHMPAVQPSAISDFFTAQSANATPTKRLAVTNLLLDTHGSTNNTVALIMSLVVDDEEGLAAILRDGASVALVLDIDISRKRSFWSNANIYAAHYTLTMRYNSLTREFSMTPPGADYPFVDRNFSRLIEKSWSSMHFLLGDRQLLLDDAGESLQDYLLTVEFGLEHTEVPPWLANGSLFWSSELTPKQVVTRDFTF